MSWLGRAADEKTGGDCRLRKDFAPDANVVHQSCKICYLNPSLFSHGRRFAGGEIAPNIFWEPGLKTLPRATSCRKPACNTIALTQLWIRHPIHWHRRRGDQRPARL